MRCDVLHQLEATAFELWQHVGWWRLDNVDLAAEQRVGGATDHGLNHFDARLRALFAKSREAVEQHLAREEDFDGEADFRLPPGGERLRRLLQFGRIADQRQRAAVEYLPG